MKADEVMILAHPSGGTTEITTTTLTSTNGNSIFASGLSAKNSAAVIFL